MVWVYELDKFGNIIKKQGELYDGLAVYGRYRDVYYQDEISLKRIKLRVPYEEKTWNGASVSATRMWMYEEDDKFFKTACIERELRLIKNHQNTIKRHEQILDNLMFMEG